MRADLTAGKQAGIHTGRVAVRATGLFNIQTATAVVQGVNAKRCTLIQRGDGYGYRSGASSAGNLMTRRSMPSSRNASSIR